MKTFLKPIGSLVILTLLMACNDDEPLDETPGVINPVEVRFGSDLFITENVSNSIITIEFEGVAPLDGQFLVEVTTLFPNAFYTNPAAIDGEISLNVAKGDSDVSFEMITTDNNVLEEDRSLTFEIVKVSDGFRIGERNNMQVTIVDDEYASVVDFASSTGSFRENETSGFMVLVTFSSPPVIDGQVVLKVTDPFEPGFLSIDPAPVNSRLTLPVLAGQSEAVVRITSANNAVLTGHDTIRLELIETTGTLVKGSGLNFKLILLDDELIGRARSFETVTGSWRSMKGYEYDESGRVSRVYWETETPFLRSGVDTYSYASNGLINKIAFSSGAEERFYHENDVIVRSEVFDDGIVSSYKEYDYDAAGNVGGVNMFHRQSDGSYLNTLIFIYLYFTDGNLFSQLTYIPVAGPEEYQLISTRKYENYLNKINLFPMVEVIPGIPVQRGLASTFSSEENGLKFTYGMTYEFNEEGMAISRSTGSGSGFEWTTYTYY